MFSYGSLANEDFYLKKDDQDLTAISLKLDEDGRCFTPKQVEDTVQELPLTRVSQKQFRAVLGIRKFCKLVPKLIDKFSDKGTWKLAQIAWEFADLLDTKDADTVRLIRTFLAHADIPETEAGFWEIRHEAMALQKPTS